MATLLAVVFFLVLLIAPLVLIGNWILKPLEDVAKSRKAPLRFSVGDLLCLALNVQLPIGLLAWLTLREETSVPAPLVIVGMILGLIVWISSAARLSRAGVSRGKDRFIFLGFVVPVAFYGLPFFVGVTWVLLTVTFFGETQQLPRYQFLALPWLLTGVALAASSYFTRRMIRDITDHSEPSAEQGEIGYRQQIAGGAVGLPSVVDPSSVTQNGSTTP